MYKDSIYNKMYESSNQLTNTGFDYRSESLLNKFLSNRMYGNPVMDGFLQKIDPYFSEMIDSVKKIQLYNNFTIDKNDGSINL